MQMAKDLPYERLLVIANDLPDLPEMRVGNAETLHKLKEIEMERDALGAKKQEVEEQLNILGQCKDASVSYARFLTSIHKKIGDSASECQCCPLCHGAVPEIDGIVKEAVNARDKLQNELENLGIYNIDNTESVESLLQEKIVIDDKLRGLNSQISRMNEYSNVLKAHSDRKAEANKYKGRIEWVIKEVLDVNKKVKARETLDELRDKCNLLEKSLKGYDIDHKYGEANTLLSKHMNHICSQLDFEDELKPPKLRFDTKSFDFFHIKDNDRIRLYEMGSGANWLACHLSLFLGLLWYSCSEKTSIIPKLLFLDQPSQVYFPRGDEEMQTPVNETNSDDGKSNVVKSEVPTVEEDDNIRQVKNIFTVIARTIQEIEKDTGVTPQVILTEHADPVKLGLRGFDECVIRRWTSGGQKLI
jgi:hypothetical protein